jgi:hypothetical protein
MMWASSAASAEPESSDPQAVESARFDFAEGTAHFQARRYENALKSFEHSFTLVESPNTQLMIARCLRELGRRADAVAAYTDAATEARKRATRGETKYTQTADAAAAEEAQVRTQLGTLHVHVARPAGAIVTVDKRTVSLSTEGDATLLHDPGLVSVAVRDNAGAEQRQAATVAAGTTVQMDFSGAITPTTQPPLEPPPPAPHPHQRTWAFPAALVAGGVVVVAGGVFIGFGASSQSTYDTLRARCGDHCGPADRATADGGKRAQTIANVGLGVSIVALVATAVFISLELTSEARSDRKSSRSSKGKAPPP